MFSKLYSDNLAMIFGISFRPANVYDVWSELLTTKATKKCFFFLFEEKNIKSYILIKKIT